MEKQVNPWHALWALCIGFFMILVDSTIVAVANPAIMEDLGTDINKVVWVTSAYLLAYAVPLLVTGRLGDRFGPKNLYMIGLVLFTGASLWCGLSGSVEMLIVARAFQGLGAAMMTPQTMAVITRTFAPNKRGAAMGLWGAVAGVATLVGPLAGGVLVDNLGWEWIFIVNVPVGVIAFLLAWKLVPSLPTSEHKFDIPGVILSAAGMFLLVFGIQEGSSYDWNGFVWSLIGAGVVLLAVFVFYQSRNKNEPLLPLELFKDRNFSLANVAITAMGFAITSMVLPLMFYTQAVRGLSPTQSALLLVPMAVLTGIFAPIIGKLVDKTHPRYIAGTGFLLFAIALGWLALVMSPDVAIWELLLPIGLIGFANACIWSPLAATATHNLPPMQAGAGAGVYNTTRQVGAVLGSAAIGALITARLAAQGLTGGSSEAGVGHLPEFVREPFSTAMSESIWLPPACCSSASSLRCASLGLCAATHTTTRWPSVPKRVGKHHCTIEIVARVQGSLDRPHRGYVLRREGQVQIVAFERAHPVLGTDVSAVVANQFEDAAVHGVGVRAVQDVEVDVSLGDMSEEDRNCLGGTTRDHRRGVLGEGGKRVQRQRRVEFQWGTEQSDHFGETLPRRPQTRRAGIVDRHCRGLRCRCVRAARPGLPADRGPRTPRRAGTRSPRRHRGVQMACGQFESTAVHQLQCVDAVESAQRTPRVHDVLQSVETGQRRDPVSRYPS